ncbi:MAG: DMT family transporter [Nanoarchaeota archaeon]|nr:DMT family transporter [Nanoarchaeota archaeon]
MKRGILLVFLTAIISGVSIFLNAFGVKGINPYMFTGAKNVVVALFLFSIILLSGQFKELKKLKFKEWGKLSLIGLVGGSIPFLLFFKGLSMASSAQGSFIHKTMIIWVVILAMIFFKEKLNSKIIAGSILLLICNFFLLNLMSFEFNTGALLIFIATLFWAAEIVLSKQMLKNLSGNVVAFGRMFFGSLFIMVFLGLTNQLSVIQSLTLPYLSWILITSVFLFGYVFTFYNGLKLVKVSTAVAILSFGSVVTTMLNFVFSNQLFLLGQVFGVLAVVCGASLFLISSNQIKKSVINFKKTKFF